MTRTVDNPAYRIGKKSFDRDHRDHPLARHSQIDRSTRQETSPGRVRMRSSRKDSTLITMRKQPDAINAAILSHSSLMGDESRKRVA
jgi:hypothetical protein